MSILVTNGHLDISRLHHEFLQSLSALISGILQHVRIKSQILELVVVDDLVDFVQVRHNFIRLVRFKMIDFHIGMYVLHKVETHVDICADVSCFLLFLNGESIYF